MEIFTNPTEDQKKFLTPFEIGSEKILLYGQPINMSMKSELIESILPNLSTTDPNPIAPDEKVNPNSLNFLWVKLNGVDTVKSLSLKDLVELWPLLNYFNINVKDKVINEYLKLITLNANSIMGDPEYNSIFLSILNKANLIDPLIYSELKREYDWYEENKRLKHVALIDANGDRKDLHLVLDSGNLDKSLLRYVNIETIDNKRVIVDTERVPVPILQGLAGLGHPGYVEERVLYTYPEYDPKLNMYVIRPIRNHEIRKD